VSARDQLEGTERREARNSRSGIPKDGLNSLEQQGAGALKRRSTAACALKEQAWCCMVGSSGASQGETDRRLLK